MTGKPISGRVLVVDDDAMSRELLGLLLAAEGYEVEAAESGRAAVALLDQGEPAPDLVLADVQMPGMTGSRLASELRRACGPLTLLLAMSGSQPAKRSIAGFDGFLLKPFKMREIAAALAGSGTRTTTAVPASALELASKPGMNIVVHDAPVRESTSGAETSGLPVLNEKIFQQLAGSVPAQQLQEMYAMCVNDTRQRIRTMRRLAEEHDDAKFVREAHSIKGGCGMLGATELHGMAAELENHGLEAVEGAVQVNSLDELAAACDRLERMLGSRV
jgi:CheY-like chemotaxis protein